MRRTTIAVVAALTGLAVVLPAGAATPSYKEPSGPASIAMTKKPTKAGKVKIVVTDKAEFHNYLTGPGVNVKTSVPTTGTKTFNVTLKKGTYKFVCDPHASQMKGSFQVT